MAACVRNRAAALRFARPVEVLFSLLLTVWTAGITLLSGDQPAPEKDPPPPPVAEPAPSAAATAGDGAEDDDTTPLAAAPAGDQARINTLHTLGKIGWQDARFRTRTVLEIGDYTVPAPRNPANRIFLLQDKNPTWAGGWLLIKRGPGGAGFALYDETGKVETPVVLAQVQVTPADLAAAGNATETWELVRLAWNAQNRKRFFLYSEPTQPEAIPAVSVIPNDFPPLLLRTFPVRPSNFDNLDEQPVSVDVLRNRLFDPRLVGRGPVGRRFMIDDRENPFGNLNSHDYYAAMYDGFLLAPVAGRYRFFLEADSHGLLLIDANFLLDVDAMAAAHGSAWRGLLHGLKPTDLRRASRTSATTLELRWRRPLEIDLTPGLHRITLVHAEITGDQGVRLAWQLPDEPQPHLIAPDCFQSLLPAQTLGWQLAAGNRDKPTPGGFVDSVQLDLIERVLVNGNPHNRIARLRAQWQPAPPMTDTAGGSNTPTPTAPRWQLPASGLLPAGGGAAAVIHFCQPIAKTGSVLCSGAAGRNMLIFCAVPDDLSDQGYLRENARLTVASETTFAYPGEDWTLHLSADRAYGDLIQPRLHICFETAPTSPAAHADETTQPAARAGWQALPEARLRINGQAATTPLDPRVYTIELPWNGPTRTPVRIDLDPAALIQLASEATPNGGAGTGESAAVALLTPTRTVTMTVWIEAAGVPLDSASWTFGRLPPPPNNGGAGTVPGTLSASRDRLEWTEVPQSAGNAKPQPLPVLPPPFASLTPHPSRAVLILDREDPSLHRRSLISSTVAALATARQAEAVLFIGDTLQTPIDLKRLARSGAVELPRMTTPPGLEAVVRGPMAAAAALARKSRSGQWIYLPLATVYQANLRGWATGATDRSDLFSETVEAGDAPQSVAFAMTAALQAVSALAGGNGLAVVSLGPRDCQNGLAIEQNVRGLDATIDQLRRRGYPRIVVLGPIPVAGSGDFNTAAASALSRALADLCLKHGVRYIDAIEELQAVDVDLQKLFRESGGERILQTYPQADGLKRLEEAVQKEQ